MKRILSLALALLCVLSLTGCRSHEENRTIYRQLSYARGTLEPDLPTPMSTDDDVTLDEQMIYEKKGVTVTVLGIYEDEACYCIPFSVKNESSGSVSLSSEYDFTVNGWGCYSWLDCNMDIVSGGVDYITLMIDRDSLPQVLQPGRICGSLALYGEDYGTRSVTVDLTTSAGEGVDKPLALDNQVWQHNDLSLYLTQMENSYHTITLGFCVYNEGESSYMMEAEGALSLCDFPDDSLYDASFVDLGAHGKAYFELRFYSELLDEDYYADEDDEEGYGLPRDIQPQALDLTLELTRFGDYSSDSVTIPIHVDLTQIEA